ncbi:MAG TPA: flagellar hook-associated protein FlgK, partial [Phycisphaerales bacterium]|nr:flagellar hook-associated protein FlgK [Phycisphaerales bacterium]
MSLTAAMLASQSALHAAQAGIQVAANNIANAATPGYSRQVAHLSPIRGVAIGNGGTIGRGVIVQDVRRQVNEALLARSWGSMSEHAAAEQRFQAMSAVESALNELSGFDLSSELAAFFNAWSERANLTESSAVVVQRGLQLADSLRRLRSDLGATRAQIDAQLAGEVAQASSLLDRIADINRTIADAEQGVRTANDLRDQRDLLIGQLAEVIDVNVVEQPDGRYDVLIGSAPVVLGGTSRGLEMRRVTIDGVTRVEVTIRASGQEVAPAGGRIGGLLEF